MCFDLRRREKKSRGMDRAQGRRPRQLMFAAQILDRVPLETLPTPSQRNPNQNEQPAELHDFAAQEPHQNPKIIAGEKREGRTVGTKQEPLVAGGPDWRWGPQVIGGLALEHVQYYRRLPLHPCPHQLLPP